MHQVAANVLLLSLAAAVATRDGLGQSDISRFLRFRSTPAVKKELLPATQSPHPEKVAENLIPEHVPSPQETKSDRKFDFGLLLKEIKSCRKRFPNMSDRRFSFRLYGVLLSELTKAPNKTTSRTFCNISEGLVDGLRETLHELEVFQSKLLPRNNSTESPGREESSQQTNNPEIIYSRGNVLAVEVENNLKLKVGDEWIPLDHKVNHLSHIYLGNSIFPLLTEESRIIDKYHTLPNPSTTKKTLPSETQVQRQESENLKRSSTFEKVHHLLTPFRWQLATRKRQASRFLRSLQGGRKKNPEPEAATTESTPVESTFTENTLMENTGFHDYTTPAIRDDLSTSTHPDESDRTKGTKKGVGVKTKHPYCDMLQFLLTSWRDDLKKINKGTLFD